MGHTWVVYSLHAKGKEVIHEWIYDEKLACMKVDDEKWWIDDGLMIWMVDAKVKVMQENDQMMMLM